MTGRSLRALGSLAPGLGDRLFEELEVHLEADGRYVAGLLGAEQVPGAPDLQVPHGDGEPAP